MNIYDENAFRILGLPVTASRRDIVRRVEEMQTLMTIGKTPYYHSDISWIGEFHRNEESVRRALQVLENPNTKLVHLLSWFWIIDKHDNLAIDALNNGDIDNAVNIWSAAARQKDSHHKKNLATLEQILTFWEIDSGLQHLDNCIKYWSELTSKYPLSHFVKKLDKELSENATEIEVNKFIGESLIQIAMPLFERWIEESHPEKIGQFFADLSISGLPQKIIDYIRDNYVKTKAEIIEKMCNELSEEGDDFEQIYIETKAFYEEVRLYFEQISQADDVFLEESCGDKIGKIILDRAILYGNNTLQWQKSTELCELAETFISGTLLRERFEESFKVVTDNIEKKKIWGNVKKIKKAPFNDTFYGIGTSLYGHSNYDSYSRSYETTRYFVVFHFPILPIARYRVAYAGDNYIKYLGKIPFRPFDKLHLAFAILGFFMLGVIGIARNDITSYTTKTYTQPQSVNKSEPNRDYSYPLLSSPGDPLPDSKLQKITALERKIDSAEKKLKTMGVELLALQAVIDDYSIQITNLNEEIDEGERKMKLGLYVNEFTYRSNIQKYNNLINEGRDTFENYFDKRTKYDDLLKATNEDIQKYNFLIGAK